MMNNAIMIGNLVKDPELRHTATGIAVTSFRIAVGHKFKANDELKEETLFIGVVVFGKRAESCAQYLKKGSSVLVDGRLKENSWEKDGQKHSRMEIVANEVKFMPKHAGSMGPDVAEENHPRELPPPNSDEPF